MLHELLLALSGHPSSLLSPSLQDSSNENTLRDLLSPAETELLRSLAQDLGEKQRNIRERASAISVTHVSVVCRAVSTAIVSTHLEDFQRKILEVEKGILEGDSSLVGAYNIVPLSGLVGAFDGWGRKLEWLWKLAHFIQPVTHAKDGRRDTVGQRSCTASQILEKLRDSTHTGYPDIEQISLHLTKVAEGAWLKQISAWVLYGRLPSLGAADFFIYQETGKGKANGSTDIYSVKASLVPAFITQSTANSILFIGKSLNHIRDKRQMGVSSSTGIAPELELLPSHLAHLSSLGSPISPSTFSAKISAIRLSLSKNALQKLLPQSKVLELLRVFKDFFLLERGEFALALIAAADERLLSRQHRSSDGSQRKGFEGLSKAIIKEGEVAAVLARAWTTLSLLQSTEDDDNDEDLDLARGLLRLSIKPHDTKAGSNVQLSDSTFDDFLLPTPAILSLRIPSPLDLVFSPSDVDTYSQIHAYLLAIRRGHLRLSQLFLLTVLRRDHPSPRASNHLNHRDRMNALASNRQRADRRAKTMRPVWAAVGSAIFLLAELGEYLQGQVIKSSWEEFHIWLDPFQPAKAHDLRQASPNPGSPKAESAATLSNPLHTPHDPETLSLAHARYLSALTHHLLLTHAPFTAALHALLLSTTHLCALTQRLATVQHALDIGVQDAFSNHAAEERKLWTGLDVAGKSVENHIKSLVEVLREIDRGRTGGSAVERQEMAEGEEAGFTPWGAWGVERLLLKLDWARGEEAIW